ncbi:MBL fold metallo-hydrolase [Sphingomonas sp. Leaf412]|uniref:MBL fold metallo-hydrolase n=1 Tax=Sphingomonas sp. Leaf412 TaxID=1736370 RepID=UPI0006F3FB68|nr:MBL fold metallo-hydrolase [Sphingomonas sp. Leaf412]KQT34997.1 MBL fold metallo-hydrolase [Sphingomonas sp. Leaf412]
MRRVTLTRFRVGHCRHPQAMTIRGGRWAPVAFPALAFLIRHPEEGAILFDTGYDPAFWQATRPFPERLYRWATPPVLPPGQALAEQLATAGVAPGEVRHLILSHFHADHMAGTHRFPNATIHAARAGWDAMCHGGRLASVRRGMLRALAPGDLLSRIRWFEDAAAIALPADCAPFATARDLLGDGSLRMVELPGHCPGHWGLVTAQDAGLHFLVADAAWSSAAIRTDTPPPWITATLLGDAAAGRATLHDLHRLRTRNPDIRLTPSHCAECAAAP